MESRFSARRRTVIVTILALLWAAFALPNLLAEFIPMEGCFGYFTASRGIVTHVECAAARAGIRPGDRVLYEALPLDERYNDSRPGLAGAKVTLPVLVNGRLHMIPLVSDPDITSRSAAIATAIRKAAQIIFIVIAAMILLQRPSRLTWGFYLYALGMMMVNVYFYTFLPALPYYALQWISYMLSCAGGLGLLVFALRFPHDRVSGRRASVERGIPYAWAALGVYIALVYAGAMTGFLGFSTVVWLQYAPSLLFYALAWFALSRYYRASRGGDRLRARWAICGTLVGTFLYLLDYANFPIQWMPRTAFELVSAVANLIIPLAIGYAIVRHRIFDTRVIVNRTVVSSALGFASAAVFVAANWLLTKTLPVYTLHVAVTVALAFAMGYATAKWYGFFVAAIDRAIFRRRWLVTTQLREIRLAVEAQTDSSEIARLLLDRPCAVLGLASAALFKAAGDGGFIREDSIAWPVGSVRHLLAGDAVLRAMRSRSGRPFPATDLWPNATTQEWAGRPRLGFPVVSQGHAIGLVFYGAHNDGSEIVEYEARALLQLCAASAPVFAQGVSGATSHRYAESISGTTAAVRRLL